MKQRFTALDVRCTAAELRERYVLEAAADRPIAHVCFLGF